MTSGTLRLDARPIRDADVLRIDGTSPTAITKSDADGRYVLDGTGDRLVARVTAPIIGAWIQPVSSPDFTLARTEIVRIRIDFQPPAGTEIDWLDVKLTPRREEVPPRVILAAGVEPGLFESMFATRINETSVELDVRAGLYDFRANRIVYDLPKGAPLENLIADRVDTDGPPAVPKFGGFEVELGKVTRLAVTLRRMTREEM